MASENPLSILLAEDEAGLRCFITRVLAREGYSVRSVSDGNAAAELFHNDPEGVGLLLTDIDMPHKSGIELIREIKSIRPGLPVLVMSGNLDKWNEVLEGVPCIAKPFSVENLLRMIAECLKSGEAVLLAT